MKILIIIVVIFGLLAAGCSTTTYLNLTENNKEQVEQKLNDYEQNEDVGAEITISLNYLTKINGELLSVRESSLIICTEYSATEEVLASLKYPITTVPNDKIKELTIEGNKWDLDQLINWCRKGPAMARVNKIDIKWKPYEGRFYHFRIIR